MSLAYGIALVQALALSFILISTMAGYQVVCDTRDGQIAFVQTVSSTGVSVFLMRMPAVPFV